MKHLNQRFPDNPFEETQTKEAIQETKNETEVIHISLKELEQMKLELENQTTQLPQIEEIEWITQT